MTKKHISHSKTTNSYKSSCIANTAYIEFKEVEDELAGVGRE